MVTDLGILNKLHYQLNSTSIKLNGEQIISLKHRKEAFDWVGDD